MQQSFGKNEIAIGGIYEMIHYNLSTVICFLLFVFPNEKVDIKNTPQTTGILFPYVAPFSVKIDGGGEKLFMDSLPRLLHKVCSQSLLDSQGCA